MTIRPGLLLGASTMAMLRALERAGAPRPIGGEMRGPADLFNLVGLQEWLAAADRYATD
jgi:hypothetical protein